MHHRVRLIAIDIDGTLLPSTSTTISARNCRALQAAEGAGIHVVISTGRRHAYALPIAEQAGLRSQTIMISSNGSVVRNFAGELLSRTLLDLDVARALCGALRAYGQTVVFTFDREGPESLAVENLAALHEQIAKWVEANRPYLTEVRPLENAFETGEAPIQGMLCGPVAAIAAAERGLRASPLASSFAMHRTEYPQRDLSILDLLPPGCSKGVALRALAQSLHIEPSEVMAIGDNYNDIEMLEFAGQAVLMKNASPGLSSLGAERDWYVTASNDDDGVALAIERALLAHGEKVTSGSATEGKTAPAAW